MKYPSKKILLCVIVAFAALAIRIAAFSFWVSSPFTEYSKIAGLDMKTHLELAKSFAEGNTEFSLYRAICAAMIKISSSDYPVKELVLFQYLCGIFSSVLVTLICFNLTSNKIIAAIAGLSSALYAPLLMYESFTLPEALFVSSSLAALYACIRAGTKKPFRIFTGGLLIALPSTVRFSGIFLSSALFLWFVFRLLRKKEAADSRKFLKPFAIFASGSLCAIVSILLINYFNSGHFMLLPGRPNISYILRAGAEMEISPEENIGFDFDNYNFERKTAGYINKFLALLKPYEIPNNLNYYFIKNQFPIMGMLVGPMLLIPLGLSGFLTALSRPSLLKRYSVLFFYFLALSLPIIVFIPLARYRIALIPVFAFFSGFFVISVLKYLRNSQNNKPLPLLLALLLYIVILSYTMPKDFPLRSEDFVGYGQALENKMPDSPDILFAYVRGYELAPDSQSAVAHLANYLMSRNRFHEARAILEDFTKKLNGSKVKILFAASLLGCGEIAKAKEILEKVPEPDSKRAKVNYYYQLAECHRLLRDLPQAKKYYSMALQFAETDSQRNIINNAIQKAEASILLREGE